MDTINLGRTGLRVSRLCLGCMSYGDPKKWLHPWVLDDKDSMPFFKRAIEAGINFFDTANIYSLGASEEITGRALKKYAKREEVVIATKVFNPMRDDPNAKGLSRKSIMTEIDASLKRLDTDYVDLYQIHRWDDGTPVEEVMEALHDVVKAGKARYIGASSMYAWQFAKAQYVADLHGWTRFVSMQPHYNLLYREEEREMLPFCVDQGVGVIPWSPLARGRLARPSDAEATKRLDTDVFGKSVYQPMEESNKAIIDTVQKIAVRHGVPMAQIGLAWVLSKPAITAPIIGATKMPQLEDAIQALNVKLDLTDIAELEAHYTPRDVAGLSPPAK